MYISRNILVTLRITVLCEFIFILQHGLNPRIQMEIVFDRKISSYLNTSTEFCSPLLKCLHCCTLSYIPIFVISDIARCASV